MAIRFFNTMTRQKEDFRPLQDGLARMYTCGPTVYDYAHIGNFRAYTFEDVLRRYLKFRGCTVRQVMNITDVEDKIIRKCRETGLDIPSVTQPYIEAFHTDLSALNIEPAEVYPRATAFIPDMVRIVQALMEKGIAYRGDDGSIYYSISKFPDYGHLAHIQVDELKSSGRINNDEYTKEGAGDFALWKAYDENDGNVWWDTELGKGRPGWHIECTAMSMDLLGETFDIHTGGEDNIFPHHENEIAQSEAFTGKKFVNTWMHCKHLLVNNQKMSKSLGNFYTLRSLMEKGTSPMAVRYIYVSSQYNRPLNFTLEDLERAERTVKGLYDFLQRLRERRTPGDASEAVSQLVQKTLQAFVEHMDDDLDTPGAVETLFQLEREINKSFGTLSEADARGVLEFYLDVDRVLGLRLDEGSRPASLDDEIEGLIADRNAARKAKDFKRSDAIRDQLKARGIILEDTPEGTRWKLE